MFYTLIGADGCPSWWSGFITFELTPEDIYSMYRESKKKEPPSHNMIMKIDDAELATKIMTTRATFSYDTLEWSFEERVSDILIDQ